MAQDATPEAGPVIPGLTNPRRLSLDRFPIRTRGSGVTRSGWRLAVSCDEGSGAIVILEAEDGEPLHRGEGVFLGWPATRLEEAYRRLLPPAPDPQPDPGQGG